MFCSLIIHQHHQLHVHKAQVQNIHSKHLINFIIPTETETTTVGSSIGELTSTQVVQLPCQSMSSSPSALMRYITFTSEAFCCRVAPGCAGFLKQCHYTWL